jgi:hypothetical protein
VGRTAVSPALRWTRAGRWIVQAHRATKPTKPRAMTGLGGLDGDRKGKEGNRRPTNAPSSEPRDGRSATTIEKLVLGSRCRMTTPLTVGKPIFGK